MNNDLRSLGSMLRDGRNQLGFSLREVEARTKVSNAYISQLEGGRIKQPSPQILHKLCDLYQCSYPLALELAGYPLPSAPKGRAANARFLARLGKTTPEEERALVEYLEFLRSRRRWDTMIWSFSRNRTFRKCPKTARDILLALSLMTDVCLKTLVNTTSIRSNSTNRR
jgi:HTH-type transcriptional regulator, competence development regulator